MAKFIPEEFPPPSPDCPPHLLAGYQGEHEVYRALKSQLNSRTYENWVVFHSWKQDRFLDGWDNSCEVDFIILIPNKGVVFLEVKNWNWAQCQGMGGDNWYLRGKRVTSPLDQLRGARNAIMKQWEAAGISTSVPYSTQVILVNLGENADLDRHYFLYGNWRENLPEKIKNNFSEQAGNAGFPSSSFKAVYGALMRCRHFSYNVADYARQLEAASAPVDEMMYMLRHTKTNVHVKGLAGTGKTVLAVKECLRVAKEGERRSDHRVRILFVCYNRGLYCKLRENPLLQEARKYAQVTVTYFHKYVADSFLSKNTDQNDVRNSDWNDEIKDYYEEVYRDIHEILDEVIDEYHYDYIFVDEAQDFKYIWFKEVLEPSLWQHLDETAQEMQFGKLYLFSDVNQTLYERDRLSDTDFTVIQLNRNLRNSRQIARCGNEALKDDRVVPLPFSGEDVVVHRVREPEARARKITEEVERIRATHGAAADIVVLVPSLGSMTVTSLSDNVFRIVDSGRWRRIVSNEESLDSSRIPVYTIKSFKGLEANFVILADIPGVSAPGNQGGEWYSESDFYVACTRAMFSLIILPATEAGYREVKDLVTRSQAD